jgi:comEA protein
MRRARTRVLLCTVLGLLAIFFVLVFATPAPRRPGVYVATKRSASRASIYTGRSPSVELAPGEKVNLNTAGQEELEQLDGVGQKLALAILEYRSVHGSFHSVEELTRVKGFGAERLERIRSYLTVE